MGYHLNRLDEPVLIAVSKPLLTEFGIHLRLESCELELLGVAEIIQLWRNFKFFIYLTEVGKEWQPATRQPQKPQQKCMNGD